MMHKGSTEKRLLELRKGLELNQEQIADKLGITKSYWSALERGARKPSSKLIKELVSTFGVSIDWLISGEGNPPQSETISTPKMNNAIDEKRKLVSALYYKLVQIIELTEKTFSKDRSCDRYLENIKKIISYVDDSPVEKLSFDKKSEIIHQLDALLIAIRADFDELFDKYHRDFDHPKRRIKFEVPSNVMKLSAVVVETKNYNS